MYIYGHKNPDTDAIVSAVVASRLYKALGYECQALRLGELNKETQFVQEYFGFAIPELKEALPDGSQVVLVDHNEISQSLDNLNELEIFAIIDHHKFNLKTSSPLNIRAEIIGSTASILYKMFVENSIEIDKQTAGMLIAAIISDTLYFRSPTSTEQDREIVEKLNKIAGIADLETFSLQMFDAKSDLSEFTPEQIITMDYKPFDFNGKKFCIGVMETTSPDFALNMQQQLIEAQVKIKSENNLDGLLFFVVDILHEQSTAITCSEFETQTVLEAFEASQVSEQILNVGSIVSRKKQIVPILEAYFS